MEKYMSANRKKIQCHVSVDDTDGVFQELCDEKYRSIWQHPFWYNLRKLHEKWGCSFTLYVFGGLENKLDLFKKELMIKELQECSTWIKAAYHGNDSEDIVAFQENFCMTKRFLSQLMGEDAIAHIIRLHRFQAAYDVVDYLESQGVKGLLTADDNRLSYDLCEEQVQNLRKEGVVQKGSMMYLHTDVRLEKWEFLTQYYDWKKRDCKILVLFTHERYIKKRFSFVLFKLGLLLKMVHRSCDVNYICK